MFRLFLPTLVLGACVDATPIPESAPPPVAEDTLPVVQEAEPNWTKQRSPAPVLLGIAVVQSAELFEDLELEGFDMRRRVDREQSECFFDLRLPPFPQSGAHADNVLSCKLVQTKTAKEDAAPVAALRLPLSAAELAIWGNKSSLAYRQRENLPYEFDTQGTFAQKLFSALKYMHQRDPAITYSSPCEPFGRICSPNYGISLDPDDEYAASHLGCDVELTWGVATRSRCRFYDPDGRP